MVVFPLPDAPTMAVTFPSGMSNDTPSRVFFKAWESYLKFISSILIDFSELNAFA